MDRQSPSGGRTFSVLSPAPDTETSGPGALSPERGSETGNAPRDLQSLVPSAAPGRSLESVGASSQAALTGAMTPEAQLRAQFRQRAAAAASAPGDSPAPGALWLLTGEPDRSVPSSDQGTRSRALNILLTIVAIIVVVFIVFGILLVGTQVFATH